EPERPMPLYALSTILLQASPAKSSLGSLYDMLVAGGPVMIPIGLCSVVALAFIVERAGATSSGRLLPSSFRTGLDAALTQGGKQAVEFCEKLPKVAAARVFGSGLRRFAEPRAAIEGAVEDAAGREVTSYTTRLRPLAVIATLGPLLGLLGTVIGMITSFRIMSLQTGIAKPESLAGGIAQALVSTAAGLCVAIPAQIAYFWLRARVDRFGAAVERLYDEVVGRRLDAREAEAAAVAAPVASKAA